MRLCVCLYAILYRGAYDIFTETTLIILLEQFIFLYCSKDETLRLYPVESVIIALPGASVFSPPGGRMMQRIEADKMQGML